VFVAEVEYLAVAGRRAGGIAGDLLPALPVELEPVADLVAFSALALDEGGGVQLRDEDPGGSLCGGRTGRGGAVL
jgi:hypothetical protein